MGMIRDLWEIGKEIFDMSDKLKKQDKEKRESLSTLLGHIGDVLEDTYEKLSKKIYPHGNCEQLEVFSGELYQETKDILGDEEAKRLAAKLKQAHEVEKLHWEVENGKIDKKELVQLDSASGYFIAASKLVLV